MHHNIKFSTQLRIMAVSLDPAEKGIPAIIYLNEARTAWIELDWLAPRTAAAALSNFETLWAAHPAERAHVLKLSTDEDVPRERWQQSFGETPIAPPSGADSTACSSWYMFGSDGQEPLPAIWEPFRAAACAATGASFNQSTIVWYENIADRMQMHRDWHDGLVSPVTTLTLTPAMTFAECRKITLLPASKALKKTAIYPKGLNIVARHGLLISLHGAALTDFMHGMFGAKDMAAAADISTHPRIAVTFRTYSID